jgi:hypothetical protein
VDSDSNVFCSVIILINTPMLRKTFKIIICWVFKTLGIGTRTIHKLLVLDTQMFDQVLDILSAFLFTRHAIGGMIRKKQSATKYNPRFPAPFVYFLSSFHSFLKWQ